MKRNPFQSARQKVIKSVYGNLAKLILRTRKKVYNAETGELAEKNVTMTENIYIANPRQVSESIVDGKNYLKGDLHVDVAYLEIKRAATLSLREVNVKDGGIDIASDTLAFDKTVYNFIRITALEFYGGEPSTLKLQLRAQ